MPASPTVIFNSKFLALKINFLCLSLSPDFDLYLSIRSFTFSSFEHWIVKGGVFCAPWPLALKTTFNPLEEELSGVATLLPE